MSRMEDALRILAATALAGALCACAPDARRDDYPVLLPFEAIVGLQGGPAADPSAAILAQGAALRARAAALRQMPM
ncbi:MAG: hypothetical protein N2422_03085 [Rhodobacteraceae bacterium]|nr:hypothetical protein [Paracoccaceae bacterium]